MVAQKDFNDLYYNKLWNKLVVKNIIKTIPFDTEWNNGTGYFDGLVHEKLGLKPGEMVACLSDDNRPMFIIGTIFGNCVFFKRYNMEHHIVNCNVPNDISFITWGLLSSSLSEDSQMTFICERYNIGHKTKAFKKLFVYDKLGKIKVEESVMRIRYRYLNDNEIEYEKDDMVYTTSVVNLIK